MTALLPETIETERLRLERLCRENVPTLDLYEHCRVGAPGIERGTEYLSWDPYPHPGEGEEFLRACEEAWDDAEDATYAIRPREGEDAGAFAGNCGLHIDWERDRGTLGIWLRKRFWGRGYSGERADALLALAFDRLDLSLVRVAHVLGNEKSRRAIEKYVEANGGRCEGEFRNAVVEDDGTVHDVRAYSVSRAEWRETGGAPGTVTFGD